MGPDIDGDYQDVNASAYGPVTKGNMGYAHTVVFTLSMIVILGVGLIGLFFVWPYIRPAILIGLVVLGFWACGHYGTNKSIFSYWPRRIKPEEKKRVHDRLSD